MPKKSATVYEEACDLIATEIEKLDQRRALLVEAWERLGGVAEIEGEEEEAEEPKLLEGPKKKRSYAKDRAPQQGSRAKGGGNLVAFKGQQIKIHPQQEKILDIIESAGNDGAPLLDLVHEFKSRPVFDQALQRLRKALRKVGWEIILGDDRRYRLGVEA